ncbi:MAG: acyl carrier protein [Candidatus Paraimprobicoccus trichonymphae]|uniref:Acyl carrier protein n=1 Tax=Candidatus Paraimprobicoccus trichonymphae TaxID=3033793 RepID=A0AA48HZ75_9FIRM|nr:MAG: acyl carrier protein [Candidatus Paraimprobicoccus trichonymphae]
MISEKVFEKVKSILSEQFDVEEDNITLETELVKNLGADSLDIADLIVTIENEFDLEIKDYSMNDIHIVGDIVDYVSDLLNNDFDK